MIDIMTYDLLGLVSLINAETLEQYMASNSIPINQIFESLVGEYLVPSDFSFLGTGQIRSFGIGILGEVVLVDPETHLPYTLVV
jgi:hypothetical protein